MEDEGMKVGLAGKRSCRWALYCLVVCVWMSMGILSDCDPETANQVLDGIGKATAGLADTVINAVFQDLGPEVPTPVTS